MQVPDSARALAQIVTSRAVIGFQGRFRREPLALLFSPAGRSDRYSIYEGIRARGPLVKSLGGGVLVVDHALCHEILRNRQYVLELAKPPFRGVDLSLLTMDPPDHTRLRRLVARAFAPSRLRLQEERIQQAVDRLLDEVTARLADGPVDLVEAYAKPLPILVIAALMGIPEHELPTLARHGDAIAGVLDGLQSMRHFREVTTARLELDDLFQRLGDQRRADPGPDIVSDLIPALDRGEITLEEYQSLCGLVLIAGFETTVNLIGNAVAALLDRPEVWQRLVTDPTLVDRVLEETLRWDSPVQLVGRIAGAEAHLGGRTFPRGQPFFVLLAAANRDPAVFDKPSEFDVDRPNAADHLAFGYGLHHCLGRPLAMLESRIALTSLAQRLPGLRSAGAPSRATSSTLSGYATLPVRT